ncbi:Retrovirus-related Pol polyprotein from transposon TNT 1-94 [Trichinella zimbabwensis]|uniref:Retrovirus-related Pol polyprotein from transposon TNT 1-94 n=1 Tax=Trichinella zimbabwensis TaxID=268475 RepID=A0A0V1GUM5_9BILA|nr:Retrovirus-related Pol polyprotein from transposon TNT 1-94 [Trichinella zimbabwensis]
MKIELLGKENYDTKKLQAQAILDKNDLWEFVSRPRKHKFIADGSIKPQKAWLVAKEFLQIPNVDFRETYAPVTRLSFINKILSVSANYGLTAHKLDFMYANVDEETEEEIYMEILEKLVEVLKCTKMKPNLDRKVCRIKEAYGLKAPSCDPTVYFERQGTEMTVAAIYGDEVIIASNNTGRLNQLKENLAKSKTYGFLSIISISFI